MKRVIVTPNPYRDKNFATARRAMDILRASGLDVRLCLPFEVDKSYELPRDLRFSRLDRELPNADMVICFGGDGTILHMATRHNLPILGVNIGTMGFMAELESTELEQLSRLSKGDYTLDKRMMLDVSVLQGDKVLFHDLCLNDAVVTKGAIARVVHLSVKCDEVQAMEFGGDGVIVATPTGSTAYSLSAGGPIVEPEANNILVTPICAHDVASRCMVASEKRVITVELTRNARRNAYLSVDGGRALRLNLGDKTIIRKADLTTKLIRLQERSFYDLVNMKFRQG